MTQQNIKRRTLVKGAAWAAPAVAVSAAVPAYAASCDLKHAIPRGGYQGVYEGAKENSFDTLLTKAGFGLVKVWNMPAGVTVTKITSTIYFNRRTNRYQHTVGAFSPSEANTIFLDSGGSGNMEAGSEYSFTDYSDDYKNASSKPINKLTFMGDVKNMPYYDGYGNQVGTWSDGWSVQKVWTPGDTSVPTPLSNGSQEPCAGTFQLQLGAFFLAATDVMLGTINEVCNSLETYTITSIEFSDPSLNIPHSLAVGMYKDDACTNWEV